MEPRLSLVTLGVGDLHRSTTFYAALGWPRVWMKPGEDEPEGIAFFQLGPLGLGLYPRAALAEDVGVPGDGTGFRGITLAHNARSKADVDACLATAVAAGATIVKPAQDVFWGGYSGYFADPDGHLWEVAWNPFFPLDDDGGLRIPATAPGF